MRYMLLCVGKLREPWQRAACAEYVKRLSRYGTCEVREVPDEPEPDKPSEALARQAMDTEGRALLAAVRSGDRVVALDRLGEALSSEELAARARAWAQGGARVALVIGGSLGLSEAVLARADERLSFGRMTFPHQLMRVIALEQLYRACKINAGERYHK